MGTIKNNIIFLLMVTFLSTGCFHLPKTAQLEDDPAPTRAPKPLPSIIPSNNPLPPPGSVAPTATPRPTVAPTATPTPVPPVSGIQPPVLTGVLPGGTSAANPSSSAQPQFTGVVTNTNGSSLPDSVFLYTQDGCTSGYFLGNNTVNSQRTWRIQANVVASSVQNAIVPIYGQAVVTATSAKSDCVKLIDYHYVKPTPAPTPTAAPTIPNVPVITGGTYSSQAAPADYGTLRFEGSVNTNGGAPRANKVYLFASNACTLDPAQTYSANVNSVGNWAIQLGVPVGSAVTSAVIPLYVQAATETNAKSECLKFTDYYYVKSTPIPTQAPGAGGFATVDNSGLGWIYAGFEAYNDSRAYQGGAHGSEINGASVTFNFTGTGIELYGWKGSDGGNFEIFLDNVSQGNFSALNAAGDIFDQRLFQALNLSNASHSLRLVKRSNAPDWVMVDYVRVFNGTASAPTVTPTPPPIVTPTPPAATPTLPPVSGQQRSSAKIFLSGHSLLDQLSKYLDPLTDQALGNNTSSFSDHHYAGTTIWYRVDEAQAGQNGNTPAQDMAMLRNRNNNFDTLLVVENHHMLHNLVFGNDTIRHLRTMQNNFIQGSPQGQTYFYHGWLYINVNSPKTWLDYEKAATRGWDCIGEQVNNNLQASGRSDRLINLPAGGALVAMMDRLLSKESGGGIPGITGTDSEKISTIFTVENYPEGWVHLNPPGWYYLSLVNYAFIYNRSPVDISYRHASVSAQTAAAFQDIALKYVQQYKANYRKPTPSECTQYMINTLCPLYSVSPLTDMSVNTCRAFFQGGNNPFR